VSGGWQNLARASATVPGGFQNKARGFLSTAAGGYARANHEHSFVWNSGASANDSLATTADGQFLIGASGGVGIGTNSPDASLHIENASQGVFSANVLNEDLIVEDGDAVVGIYSNDSGDFGSGVVLAQMGFNVIPLVESKWAMVRNTSNASNHLRFTYGTGVNYGTNNTVVRFETDGDVFADGTFTPSGADLAEAFGVTGDVAAYEPGDVLVISESADRQVERSQTPYSRLVAGVFATKPGVLLNNVGVDGDLSEKIPLAVVGVVPTKVTVEGGAIRRGDLLTTSSIEGHAMKADVQKVGLGMVIGKALENFEGPGLGLIEVLVNVK
jgi:hypothetical protein